MNNNRDCALITLAAFNGAVLGLIGCLVGALTSDAGLSLIAASGAAICAWLWASNLDYTIVGDDESRIARPES